MKFTIDCVLPFSRDDMWRIRSSAGFRRHVVEDGLMKQLDSSSDSYDAEGWGTRTQEYTPRRVECPEFVRAIVGDTLFSVTDEQRWHDELRPFVQDFRIRPSFLSQASRTVGELRLEEVESAACACGTADEGDVCEACAAGAKLELDELDDVDDDELSTIDSITESDDAGDSVDGDWRDSKAAQYIAMLPDSEKCRHTVDGETRVNLLTVGWFIERAIVKNLRIFYRAYPPTVARFRRKIYEEFADGDESVPASEVVSRFLDGEERRSAEAAEQAGASDDGLDYCLQESQQRGFANASKGARGSPVSSKDLDQDFDSIFVSV